MSEISEKIRREFKESDDSRDAGLKTPETIKRFDNIVYGPDAECQVLDVYRPKEAEEEILPVIVSVHGGGWVYGDKERYQYYCMSLAQHGFAVVNYTYRLAPEHKFPAPVEDLNLVIAWILEHGVSYGMDADSVFCVGDSAGAHLLGLYSCICTNTEFAAAFDFTVPGDFVPRAVALNCGHYRTGYQEKNPRQTMGLMADLLPQGGTKEELAVMDVTAHVTKRFPPAFLMTCTGDFLQEQSLLLANTLVQNHVPFQLHYYGDDGKRLPHVFHCDMRSPDAAECNTDECDFFQSFLFI